MGNTNPAISIIVPVYKTEKYVARCLESLINQTLRNIEIICIVAPNQDNSLGICGNFAKKDERLLVIQQPPEGLSAARNEGLKYARGAYIQFCDSDDYCAPSICEEFYKTAVDSEADLVVSGVQPVDSKNAFPVYVDPYFKVPYLGKCYVTQETFKRTNVFAWNKLFKHSTIKQYNIEFPRGLYCEDASFLFKYLMVSKTIYYIDAPLYFYFIGRSDSLMAVSSTVNAPHAMDHIYILNDIFAFMNMWGLKKDNSINFSWIVLTYMSLACKYCTQDMYYEIFNAGAALIKEIEYDDEILIKLYALKQNNMALYFCSGKQAQTSDLLLKGKLFPALLKACFLFPWYIYENFCMVYNKPPPQRRVSLFLKVYLFFPYYVLKTYLMLAMRAQRCSL
jgi:glycosyltransferase involved in cell wall biosynthesis